MVPYPERIDPRVTYEDQYFHMARPNLTDIPQFPFPPGYTLRAYRPGDEAVWTALHRAAEPFFAVDDDLFEQQYGQHVGRTEPRHDQASPQRRTECDRQRLGVTVRKCPC